MNAEEDIQTLTLDHFGISPNRGFLPDPDPILVLPDSEVFTSLQSMANYLPKLLAAGVFRRELEQFSRDVLYSVASHAFGATYAYTRGSKAVAQRTKLIMDYLGQAYVWGQNPPARVIPPGFAEFWYHVSTCANLPPILSYAPYALYNWHRINPDQPIALGNIAVTQNFLGGLDEDWFILVHVDIEQRASAIPFAAIEALKALARKDSNLLAAYLSATTESLEQMLNTLDRMTECCDPYIYYTRVRPYLHGWKNNEALPDGMLYPGVREYGNVPQQFRGESGTQSAIVPTLIAILDIRHTESDFTPYLQEMRDYMPLGFRRFIQTIERLSHNGFSIREFVIEHKQNEPGLYASYRACRQALYNFRRKHFEYVGRYIHSQAQLHQGNPTAIGTAGTPFMTSLKQLLEETWFD